MPEIDVKSFWAFEKCMPGVEVRLLSPVVRCIKADHRIKLETQHLPHVHSVLSLDLPWVHP